jgi:hypothetical protein
VFSEAPFSTTPFSALSATTLITFVGVEEGVTAAEQYAAPGIVFNGVQLEGATAQETAAAVAELFSAVQDGAQGADTQSTLSVLRVVINEGVLAVDAVLSIAEFVQFIAEGADGADAYPTNVVYNASAIEGATAADLLSSRFLWELINDSQTTNWGPIDNAQSVTWVLIKTQKE